MCYLNRTIYMPWELLEAFSKHTGLFWSGIEIEGAICDAMAAAMQPQAGQAQAQARALQDATASGYQWKQVFLPEGTVLRASFVRQPYYAVVEGSAIKYGEYSLSPSAFANLQGSGNRNAWKAVWLRFPGYPDWVRADECRQVRRALTARLFEPARPGEPGQPAALGATNSTTPTPGRQKPMRFLCTNCSAIFPKKPKRPRNQGNQGNLAMLMSTAMPRRTGARWMRARRGVQQRPLPNPA